MNFILEHGNDLIFFLFVPILGWFVDLFLPKKWQYGLLIVSSILLVPFLTDYTYVIPNLMQIIGSLWLTLVYAQLSGLLKRKTVKQLVALILNAVIIPLFSWASFMDSFGGYTERSAVWVDGNYRVEKYIAYGFSGQPYTTYTLRRYAVIPLLVQDLESVSEEERKQNDQVYFPVSQVRIDLQSGKMTSIAQ